MVNIVYSKRNLAIVNGSMNIVFQVLAYDYYLARFVDRKQSKQGKY